MLKTILFTWILLCFYSCRENKKQPSGAIVISDKVSNDTFMMDLDYQMSVKQREIHIPEGVEFNTIEKKFKKGKIVQSVEIPMLTENNLKHADSVLRGNINSESNRFLKENIYAKDKEYDKLLKDGEIRMWVVMIYKDQKVINYCFQLEYSDNILVRPYCEYYSVTYDLVKNEIIHAKNFFNIKAAEDSSELSKYILRGFDPPIKSDFNFDEIDFSMDDSVVYFFTDQYQLGIPFNHSCGIKKRYLGKFIKNEYK